jgi:hypothetical protein
MSATKELLARSASLWGEMNDEFGLVCAENANLRDLNAELLAALETLLGDRRGGDDTTATGTAMVPVSWESRRAAHAAIARAKGAAE